MKHNVFLFILDSSISSSGQFTRSTFNNIAEEMDVMEPSSAQTHLAPAATGLISHRHSMSQDSNDSSGSSSGLLASAPPTYSRMPPDGHEFPPDYKEPHLTNQVRKVIFCIYFWGVPSSCPPCPRLCLFCLSVWSTTSSQSKVIGKFNEQLGEKFFFGRNNSRVQQHFTAV